MDILITADTAVTRGQVILAMALVHIITSLTGTITEGSQGTVVMGSKDHTDTMANPAKTMMVTEDQLKTGSNLYVLFL